MSTAPLFIPGGSAGPDYLKGRDYCRIGGIEMPGKVSVTGLGLSLRVDAKDGAGSHGGHPTFRGLQAQPGAVRVCVWTDSQRQLLAEAINTLFPWPGTAVEGLSFDSFYTDMLNIVTSVVITDITALSESSIVHRGVECTFKLLQWLPAARSVKANAVATPRRVVRDQRAEDAAARRAASNPPPSARPGVAGP